MTPTRFNECLEGATRALWGIGLAAFLATSALAGPDATTNRFLNDSPSMIDWGIDRIQRHLQQNEKYGADASAYFDWETNSIVIYNSAVAFLGGEDAFEDDCRDWFRWARSNGHVNVSTGAVFSQFEHSRYAAFFGHSGFRRTISGVEELVALGELDKLISIEYQRWWLNENFETEKSMSCTGKLLATGFSVSRE